MSQNEFNHLLDSLNALSPDQMEQLRGELDSRLGSTSTIRQPDLTPEELAEQELQRRLVAAGICGEIKPPATVHARPRAFHSGLAPGRVALQNASSASVADGGSVLPRLQCGRQALRPGNRHCLD